MIVKHNVFSLVLGRELYNNVVISYSVWNVTDLNGVGGNLEFRLALSDKVFIRWTSEADAHGLIATLSKFCRSENFVLCRFKELKAHKVWVPNNI
jgi:hypothetical protein